MEKFENELALIIRENDVLTVQFKPPSYILSVTDIHNFWNMIEEIDPNHQSKILLVTGDEIIEKKARKVALNYMNTWPKVAIQVQNLRQLLIGKFAIKLFAKKDKVSVFEHRLNAVDWLKA